LLPRGTSIADIIYVKVVLLVIKKSQTFNFIFFLTSISYTGRHIKGASFARTRGSTHSSSTPRQERVESEQHGGARLFFLRVYHC